MGIASEFAGIRHDVEEVARRSPPVITFPPPPVQDINFVRPESHATLPAGAFAAGWANFGAGHQPAGYETLGTRVFLRGLVSPVSTATTAGTVYAVLTLPAGVRPTLTDTFIVLCGGPTAFGQIDVNPDGTVTFNGSASLNGFVSLGGVTFSTL